MTSRVGKFLVTSEENFIMKGAGCDTVVDRDPTNQ